MLELTINLETTNKVQINTTVEGITAFCQVLINLQNGVGISFNDIILTHSEPKSPGNVPTLENDTTSLFSFENLDYLVVELPSITRTTDKAFDMLQKHLEAFLPSLYKEVLSSAITVTNITALFDKRTVIMFQFRDKELETVSTVPYHTSLIEYIENVSLYKSSLDKAQQNGLTELFRNTRTLTTLGKGSQNHYSYYNNYGWSNNSKVQMYVKKSYFRLNSLEFHGKKVSLTIKRSYLTGSYTSNFGYIRLISAIINPSSLSLSPVQNFVGAAILTLNHNISLVLTKQSYPVVVESDAPDAYTESNNIFIELSDKDAEFLKAVKAADPSLVYTKHKFILVEGTAKEVRNCTAVYNASKTLKIVTREEKKKLSDDEAYKSRVMRDYLSHAISLVAIPIFQKEFVIPECLQKSFIFKMASMHSLWYNTPYRNRPRLSSSYFTHFNPEGKSFGWEKPEVPTNIPINAKAITSFVKEFKDKTVISSTQTRSSVFTKYFIEPFIEQSSSSYAAPSGVCMFGWMMNIDGANHGHHSYQSPDAYLLRCTPTRGYFVRECGLITDKTLGIQAIMANIFTTTAFNNSHFEYSIVNPKHGIPQDKRGQYISAVLDIYSANFVPSDAVEKAINSYGSTGYNCELARINQLLFLSEESLNIFKGLYSCETFEDLSTCLSLCMPICLDTLETLDYSVELKNHVRAMLNYFWNTTTAIAKELEADDTIKK